MKIRKLLIILLTIPIYVAQAQTPETEALEEFASPGVRGMGRSQGVEIRYERLPNFKIDSDSDDPRLGNGSGRIDRHNKFALKAYAPLLNKPQNKVVLGFNYELEEFNFENLTPASYDLYRYLEDKNLKSIGAQLLYLHSINQRNFYFVRVKGELNGDYSRDDIKVSDYLKGTVDVAYGWKKSPDYVIGVGLQWGYTFGRQRVYPGILYNRTFNPNWGVESIFPANARLRYNLNEKTLFYTGYRIEGASYNMYVNEPPLSEFKELELRRTDIKGLLRMEREIYDFIWFAVEGGFRQYYRHRVYDDIGSRNEIINNDLAGSGYVAVELYLVPPRKFTERNR
ncbi:hypothetical protein C8N40_101514 [Pontibacter mucosus]|uniref:DUF6268 domain-containing protein n=1 Tax=Pontibacter mucosus TaxID=1649266 RepID=A0A2T5YTP3_9BACT|nr:DUF6268 family outer membrane beta-barrel protein [Pontibacter mucosus]PTX22687.1 hypothetical protein C8N40_101514 [Pontibacter mucosus]